DELAIVRGPVVRVVLLPAVVTVAWLVKAGWRALGQRGAGDDQPLHALGVAGREDHARPGTTREAHQRGARRGGRGGEGDHGGGGAVVIVAARRSPRAPVARRIVGDHAEVAREVGKLGLPHPAVHDLPRRDEEHRMLTRPVFLPRDRDTGGGN